MDRTYIDNHHVVARYLADQLSEDELREFEGYLHQHPDIVQELEAAARFKVGLSKLERTGALSGLLGEQRGWQKMRMLAMAASVLIALGAILWFVRLDQASLLVASLTDLSHGGQPLAVHASYSILRTRGSSYDADVELPATSQAIELRVLPEVEAEPARYRINLARLSDDGTLKSSDSIAGLVPGDDGFVICYFDSSQLSAGRYELTIGGDAGTSAANQISRFRIRLIKANASP